MKRVKSLKFPQDIFCGRLFNDFFELQDSIVDKYKNLGSMYHNHLNTLSLRMKTGEVIAFYESEFSKDRNINAVCLEEADSHDVLVMKKYISKTFGIADWQVVGDTYECLVDNVKISIYFMDGVLGEVAVMMRLFTVDDPDSPFWGNE